MNTHEFSEYTLNYSPKYFQILVVYRPSKSEKNKTSVKDFLYEFAIKLENLITTQRTLIILGDFNIHIENKECNDSKILLIS